MFNNIKINKDLLNVFGTNFIKGGLLIGITVTIIEIIHKSTNMINFYAFVSASFFIVQLFQYKYVNDKNEKLSPSFLIHSIIGGIIFVLYVSVMYYLHLLDYSPNNIILISLVLYIMFSLLYYIILTNN